MSMATHTSQSSAANCLATNRPATRMQTMMSASAGKKKLTKSAKTWPGGGSVPMPVKSEDEEAYMTQCSEGVIYLITM